jgi:hypothetical protein
MSQVGPTGFFSKFLALTNNTDIVSCLGTANYLSGSSPSTGNVRWKAFSNCILLYSEGYITTNSTGDAIVGIGISLVNGGNYICFANNLSSNHAVSIISIIYSTSNLEIVFQTAPNSNINFMVIGPRPPSI